MAVTKTTRERTDEPAPSSQLMTWLTTQRLEYDRAREVERDESQKIVKGFWADTVRSELGG